MNPDCHPQYRRQTLPRIALDMAGRLPEETVIIGDDCGHERFGSIFEEARSPAG